MTHRFTRRMALGVLAAPLALPSSLKALTVSAIPGGSVSVAAFGAKGDGVTDDTDSLVHAHMSGKPVFYPRTEAFYRISHVLPVVASTSSNQAEIRIIGDGMHPKTIFRVSANSDPITISGFVLDGGYKGGTLGEWSHGIDLSGAKNVTITGNTIRNTYGDCVYVGSANDSIGSVNIRIHDNRLVNPRRCNVAIVCGEDIQIENNECEKKLDYVAGIDLEPDINGFDYVRHVRILRNRFSTVGRFLSAAVSNGLDNADLLVAGNHGQALEYFRGHDDARLRNVTIMRNRFAATSPKGVMLNLERVEGGVISDNEDRTACGGDYQSTRFRGCTGISLERNIFCS
jgi:hypothetical protein